MLTGMLSGYATLANAQSVSAKSRTLRVLFVYCIAEHVSYTGVRNVTASQCHGQRAGLRSRSSYNGAHQSLGPTGRLSHPQH